MVYILMSHYYSIYLKRELVKVMILISLGLLLFSERTGDSSNRQREESINDILLFSIVFNIYQSSCVFLSFIYIQKRTVFPTTFLLLYFLL